MSSISSSVLIFCFVMSANFRCPSSRYAYYSTSSISRACTASLRRSSCIRISANCARVIEHFFANLASTFFCISCRPSATSRSIYFFVRAFSMWICSRNSWIREEFCFLKATTFSLFITSCSFFFCLIFSRSASSLMRRSRVRSANSECFLVSSILFFVRSSSNLRRAMRFSSSYI